MAKKKVEQTATIDSKPRLILNLNSIILQKNLSKIQIIIHSANLYLISLLVVNKSETQCLLRNKRLHNSS